MSAAYLSRKFQPDSTVETTLDPSGVGTSRTDTLSEIRAFRKVYQDVPHSQQMNWHVPNRYLRI